MDAKQEFTGTHKVILPADFMDSIEAVCEVHDAHISAVGTNLDIPGLRLTRKQRVLRLAIAGLMIFLVPTIWLTCF